MSDQPYLTAEGAAKLKEELERLKSVERTSVSPALARGGLPRRSF